MGECGGHRTTVLCRAAARAEPEPSRRRGVRNGGRGSASGLSSAQVGRQVAVRGRAGAGGLALLCGAAAREGSERVVARGGEASVR